MEMQDISDILRRDSVQLSKINILPVFGSFMNNLNLEKLLGLTRKSLV